MILGHVRVAHEEILKAQHEAYDGGGTYDHDMAPLPVRLVLNSMQSRLIKLIIRLQRMEKRP